MAEGQNSNDLKIKEENKDEATCDEEFSAKININVIDNASDVIGTQDEVESPTIEDEPGTGRRSLAAAMLSNRSKMSLSSVNASMRVTGFVGKALNKAHKQRRAAYYGMSESDILLKEAEKTRTIRLRENERLSDLSRHINAAKTIQRAYKYYKYFTKGMLANAKVSARQKRLMAGEAEWKRQMAALTIQYYWRKYFREKLMKEAHTRNLRIRNMNDPEMRAAKQRAVTSHIYSAPNALRPLSKNKLNGTTRPGYLKDRPSAICQSYVIASYAYNNGTARDGKRDHNDGSEKSSGRNSAFSSRASSRQSLSHHSMDFKQQNFTTQIQRPGSTTSVKRPGSTTPIQRHGSTTPTQRPGSVMAVQRTGSTTAR